MAERMEGPRDPQITIEHLTSSLSQIETWCRAVREALDSIPDKGSIRFPEHGGHAPQLAKTPVQQKPGHCPPPEPDDDDRAN